MYKDMEFLQRAANKQRGRAYSQRGRRKMTRSNARLTILTAAQQTVAEVIRALRKLRKQARHKTNPLPVGLRPWVPHVRETLARKDAAALYLSAAIRKTCTKRQWIHLSSTCLELMIA